MKQVLTIKPTGLINRRGKVDDISDNEVLFRENCMVIGLDKKKIKKISGSNRYVSTSVGGSAFVWAHRYYTKSSIRKNYAFNQNGALYSIDEAGNTTSLISTFSPLAFPCSESMRVSLNDILYFSEGINTGMYSYDGNTANQFNKENSVSLNPVGMLSYLDRLFVFEEDSDILAYSKNLDPTNFTDATDAGTISVGAKRGAKIQQIKLLNQALYIFKSDSIWVLLGKTPSEFTVEEVHPWLGVAARRSVVNVESYIMFLGSDYEYYQFYGTIDSTKLISYGVAISGDFTKDLPAIINKDRMAQVCATYHNKIYRCAFNENQSVNTYNDMEYCFNTTNDTDFLTRDNNVSCYLVYDRNPDKGELVTGRSDIGRMMFQYSGLNWDNQAATPNMPIRIKTKYVNLGDPRNLRVLKSWVNFTVLSGSIPIDLKTFLDGRNANADATSDQYATQGETKSVITALKISSQDVISPRQVARFGNARGQSVSFEINERIQGRDLEFSSIQALVVSKRLKRSHLVGI